MLRLQGATECSAQTTWHRALFISIVLVTYTAHSNDLIKKFFIFEPLWPESQFYRNIYQTYFSHIFLKYWVKSQFPGFEEVKADLAFTGWTTPIWLFAIAYLSTPVFLSILIFVLSFDDQNNDEALFCIDSGGPTLGLLMPMKANVRKINNSTDTQTSQAQVNH